VRSAARREPRGWHLLVHQLPPRPLYLRAKVRQRLARAGAIALKSSVYVLPRRAECRASLDAIARDARDGGGEAWVCEATFPDEAAENTLIARFQAAAAERYRSLARRLDGEDGRGPAGVSRVRRRFEEAARVDFFDSPLRAEIERRLEKLRAALRKGRPPRGREGRSAGRTWVTRRGVQIDRMASAWLIRRFVDRAAQFRFGGGGLEGPGRVSDDLSFDVPGGDFSHEEDRCTFETLVRRHDLGADAALRHVAEIVHDVDLKDGKFRRAEAPGVARMVAGIVAGCSDDAERLERGAVFFEDLYRSFAGRP
jgi:hypothetical protein